MSGKYLGYDTIEELWGEVVENYEIDFTYNDNRYMISESTPSGVPYTTKPMPCIRKIYEIKGGYSSGEYSYYDTFKDMVENYMIHGVKLKDALEKAEWN